MGVGVRNTLLQQLVRYTNPHLSKVIGACPPPKYHWR